LRLLKMGLVAGGRVLRHQFELIHASSLLAANLAGWQCPVNASPAHGDTIAQIAAILSPKAILQIVHFLLYPLVKQYVICIW